MNTCDEKSSWVFSFYYIPSISPSIQGRQYNCHPNTTENRSALAATARKLLQQAARPSRA
jgi:hypothetical protein